LEGTNSDHTDSIRGAGQNSCPGAVRYWSG
jgi:hypothetical protein